eukprot:CAMPEP_0172570234 /NCGR_PEP_ID=MMETSP1067-20121228/126761_1 /TAXON_ID=265564 ORGANISM="Thalassiosira punctigera, Strain Tpunct2005C2" /NCGR_SAMPLE_ID=MMETSP1067 /ASSEMBLY_ACC=CAM_ASM_000444 /LENGTH=51 /DNA_ID=CAMNT_0013362289 /DNA_START=212 /DNA_END=364 /DNA_ORIENTATION=-
MKLQMKSKRRPNVTAIMCPGRFQLHNNPGVGRQVHRVESLLPDAGEAPAVE